VIGLVYFKCLELLRNPMAKELSTSKYRQRVIKNKKKIKRDKINLKEAKRSYDN